MYYVKVANKKAEIIDLSIKSQILSEYTAFLCVEKELIDGKYQEIKSLGQLKVQVSSPKPIQYKEGNILRGRANVAKPTSSLSSLGAPKFMMRCKGAADKIKPQLKQSRTRIVPDIHDIPYEAEKKEVKR